MKYQQLKLTRQVQPHRAGRGIAAGRGKTAGRGTKGQGSRKSGGVRPGFEGGQMPIYMRLPKQRGFKSRRQVFANVDTGRLDALKGVNIDNHSLYEAGLVETPYLPVKLVQKGAVKTKKSVKLQAASRSAVETLVKSGGSFTVVGRLSKAAKKSQTKEVL